MTPLRVTDFCASGGAKKPRPFKGIAALYPFRGEPKWQGECAIDLARHLDTIFSFIGEGLRRRQQETRGSLRLNHEAASALQRNVGSPIVHALWGGQRRRTQSQPLAVFELKSDVRQANGILNGNEPLDLELLRRDRFTMRRHAALL